MADTYTYSASGNPLTIEGGDVNRTLTWDAENRLRRIYDSRSGQLHLYTYNHLGERALKRYGKAQAMAVNDKDAGALLDTKDNYSAYVSPYFVRHNNRYTKHYYAGAMRIASKIGASGSTYAAGTDEPDLYFYHTDHLGSTTYITDRKEVAQYVAYTPYGETFKEYRNVTPYKFNGKELDQETGYYYYGARYYDPGTALWFGTDPLAHKYPMNSPYVYCNGNPVKYVDPDGMEQRSWEDELGDWMRDTFNSHSESQEAKNLQPIAEGIALTNPVIGITNAVLKISTGDDIYGNKVRTTDNGSKAVTNVRAVADFCEDISDVCDATAVGLAVTGVNMPVAGGLATVGTIFGTSSDFISMGIDLYEEDYSKVGVQFAGIVVGMAIGKIKTKVQRVNILIDKLSDKIIDYNVNKIKQSLQNE